MRPRLARLLSRSVPEGIRTACYLCLGGVQLPLCKVIRDAAVVHKFVCWEASLATGRLPKLEVDERQDEANLVGVHARQHCNTFAEINLQHVCLIE